MSDLPPSPAGPDRSAGPAPAGTPAGPVRRIGARLVDVAIAVPIGAVAAAGILRAVPGGDALPAQFPANLVLSLALFALYVGYEVAFTTLYGATPGKLVCRVRVVAAGGGAARRADAVSVARRSAVLYASVLFNFVPLLSLAALCLSVYAVISSLMDRPAHRGLQDVFGSTAVVRA